MSMEYIKLYHSYLESTAELEYDEVGMLFLAALEYSKTGKIPDLEGNERFLFPVMKQDIDRNIAAYEETVERNRKNGAKGGRPRKNPEDI